MSLSGSDDESGVAATYYQLVSHGGLAPDSVSSAGWQHDSGPVVVDTRGDWDVYAYSVDKAHNRESPRQVGHLGRAGLDTTKKADPSAPLKGTIVVRANSDGGTTIRKIQDFYEVHYPGNDAPAGCGLAPGEKLTGGRGGSRLVCACRQHRRREPGHVLHRAQRLTGPESGYNRCCCRERAALKRNNGYLEVCNPG